MPYGKDIGSSAFGGDLPPAEIIVLLLILWSKIKNKGKILKI